MTYSEYYKKNYKREFNLNIEITTGIVRTEEEIEKVWKYEMKKFKL